MIITHHKYQFNLEAQGEHVSSNEKEKAILRLESAIKRLSRKNTAILWAETSHLDENIETEILDRVISQVHSVHTRNWHDPDALSLHVFAL